ncbi:MAG: cupin, partial [Azorhizobium sp. 12-66-6]
DGRTARLSAGDSFYVPSDVHHCAVCIEPGVLIDVFTPMRGDFVGA